MKRILSGIDRYWVEEILYRAARAAVLLVLLFSFNFGYAHLSRPLFATSAALLAVAVQLLVLIRIPSSEMKPLSYRRTDTGKFISQEIRFALIFTALVFFTDLQVNHSQLGWFILINLIVQSLLYVVWREYNLDILKPQNMKSPVGTEKAVLIIGADKRGQNAADVFLAHPDFNIRVIGFVDFHRNDLWRYRDIPLIGHVRDIERIILTSHVDFVIMAAEPDDYTEGQRVFTIIERMGVKIILLPHVYMQTISKCQTSSLNGTPVLMYHSAPPSRAGMFVKEGLDRIGGLVGMILFSPVLMLAALAIKLESRGPVFYSQKRAGVNGRPFKMFKLRTMVQDAEKQKAELQHLNEMSGPVFKIKNDPRITRVGRILRKLSIDELPQFFNVFRGDMSLVGPRPPLPKEVEQFKPWQHRKLSVKPGLTCIWQVSGRNQIDFDDWMRQDLQYIDNWSLQQDMKLLIKTIPAVIKTRGAS
ncbi:MAG: sugar transferase [candidate division Zixibacteria bacterium]|nr:sugar transferase [candidate division Zixibacteria bacterium]